MGDEKRHVMRGGKILFSEGGGINIVFGPKYIPLDTVVAPVEFPVSCCTHQIFFWIFV
jgi:hypothetical protein